MTFFGCQENLYHAQNGLKGSFFGPKSIFLKFFRNIFFFFFFFFLRLYLMRGVKKCKDACVDFRGMGHL